MNHSKINFQLDNLDLCWQEYDFGDTFYATITADILLAKADLISNLTTNKYQVEFHTDGYAWIFKDNNQETLVKQIIYFWHNLNLWLFKKDYKMPTLKD